MKIFLRDIFVGVILLSSVSTFAQVKKWVFTPPTTGSAALTAAYAVAAGGVISIQWSGDTNPSRGGWETSTSSGCGYVGMCPVIYNFTNFDAVISQQLGFGAQKVRAVLAAAAFGGSNTFTPDYIFDAAYATNHGLTQQHTCADTDYAGSGAIAVGSCAQGVDNTAAPIYWLTTEPFRPRWIAAVVAAVNHIATCTVGTCGYSPSQVDSVRPGTGLGGETFPWGTSAMVFQVYGSIDLVIFKTDWMAYVSAMETTVNAANSGLKFIQSQNGGVNGGSSRGSTPIPYSWADSEAAIAATNGWGHGDQGLTSNWSPGGGVCPVGNQSVASGNNADIQRFATNGYTSGTTHTFTFPSFDSAFTFAIYSSANQLEVQTGGGGASDPAGRCSPGSLLLIIPYALSVLKVTDIELYWKDWQVAYDPANANYAVYHLDYQRILAGTFPFGFSGGSIVSGQSIFN